MRRPSAPELWVARLGCVSHQRATAIQAAVHAARRADGLPDVLLLLEHPPTFTLGRRAGPDDLPMGEQWYAEHGVAIASADRGGGVTYHGPGQLVAYPVMRIANVPAYVHGLERAMVAALADEGVAAGVRDGLTGVWAGEAKIGSIGIHVHGGVTTHGLAVNVDNDVTPFDWVVACGGDAGRATSVALETGRTGTLGCFSKRIAWRLADTFGLRQRLVSPARIGVAAGREPVAA